MSTRRENGHSACHLPRRVHGPGLRLAGVRERAFVGVQLCGRSRRGGARRPRHEPEHEEEAERDRAGADERASESRGHQRPPRRPVGQLEHGAPCRHASPRDLTAATEPEQHEQRQEDRKVHRSLQPGEDGACCGNREPELPHDLVGDGVHGIDEVVVVALRDEPTIPLGDDPVQNAGPRLVVLVEHDLADPVRGLRAREHEVSALEPRLHRRAREDRVRRRSAELGGAEQPPAQRKECDRRCETDVGAG